MVKGEPYTKVSDFWSLGILLYAMIAGELPFEDENTNRLNHKIIFTEPTYPSTMSSQVKDLLRRLLQKDPENRISLTKIKEHPWFSQVEYYKIRDNHSLRVFSTNPDADPVDHQVVQHMAELGYDTNAIVQAIICGEISPLTAVYRMLRKEKITDLMKTPSIFPHRPSFRGTTKFKPIPPPIPTRANSIEISRNPRVARSNRNCFSARVSEDSLNTGSPLLSKQPQSILSSVTNSKRSTFKPQIATLQRKSRSASTKDTRKLHFNF